MIFFKLCKPISFTLGLVIFQMCCSSKCVYANFGFVFHISLLSCRSESSNTYFFHVVSLNFSLEEVFKQYFCDIKKLSMSLDSYKISRIQIFYQVLHDYFSFLYLISIFCQNDSKNSLEDSAFLILRLNGFINIFLLGWLFGYSSKYSFYSFLTIGTRKASHNNCF